jgi:hypothetical protein
MSLPLSAVVSVALFHDGPFRWRTAIRRTDDTDWLQFDLETFDADVAEKARVLAADRDDAFVADDTSWEPSAEIEEWIDTARSAVGLQPIPGDERHPLERSALGCHEDLVLLHRRAEGWVMAAGAVCFPTRWSPAAKFGRSMAEIHAPVPGYGRIESAVERVLDRLRPDSVVWRPNWSLVGQADLRLPVDGRQAPTTLPDDPASRLWLRVERQTLRRFSVHDDHIVFTIRIHRWPLGEVLEQIDRALISELRSMPDEVATYKNIEAWRLELADRVAAGEVG